MFNSFLNVVENSTTLTIGKPINGMFVATDCKTVPLIEGSKCFATIEHLPAMDFGKREWVPSDEKKMKSPGNKTKTN